MPPQRPFELVYFGLVDERLDQGLIAALADALPDAVIRLIGPITTSVTRLEGLANVRLEGGVPYDRLPQAVATASLFFLPFKPNDLANSCSPIKIKEYLACGRPVVASAIPEVLQLAPFVMAARTTQEFVEAISAIRQAPPTGMDPALRHYLDAHSWRTQALAFAAIAARLREDRESAQGAHRACRRQP
jgi:glycosyltransferase involved in cell wall biosynthesis